MSVDVNANAELAMRVKALEADVAALQRRSDRLIEAFDELRQSVEAGRAKQ